VIDLNQPDQVNGYQVPARIAEKVRLRDRTCVFPYCHRPARSCDLDHIVPYDPAGPPAQTSTDNLACLCRLHHRMKTRSDWTYYVLLPGVFVWHSPHGHTWLRDQDGTTDLTPHPADPAGPSACPRPESAPPIPLRPSWIRPVIADERASNRLPPALVRCPRGWRHVTVVRH
jgi:hypothetical protein